MVPCGVDSNRGAFPQRFAFALPAPLLLSPLGFPHFTQQAKQQQHIARNGVNLGDITSETTMSRLELLRWRLPFMSLFLCRKVFGLDNAGNCGCGRTSSGAVAGGIDGCGCAGYHAPENGPSSFHAAGADGACMIARGESYLETNGFLYDVRTDPQNDLLSEKKK